MYKQDSIEEFLKKLSSGESMPGGGTASSLVGANGISLTLMVCNLTLGKEKYKDYEILVQDVKKKAEVLKDSFLKLMDKDAEDFKAIEKVFAMSNVSDEEKKKRKEAMQEACKKCCETPIEIIENALEGIELTESIIGKSNKSAASDLEVGKLLLIAAAKGAWHNIAINLKYIDDEEFGTKKKRYKEILDDL